jgi:hypothetical protein
MRGGAEATGGTLIRAEYEYAYEYDVRPRKKDGSNDLLLRIAAGAAHAKRIVRARNDRD